MEYLVKLELMKERITDLNSILRKIDSLDLIQYSSSEYYEPEALREKLIELVSVRDHDETNVDIDMLSLIGNNHRGVYYPVILCVLDIIIEVAEISENSLRKKCALAILNNLFYFEPEVGCYDGCENAELKKYANEKLEQYKD